MSTRCAILVTAVLFLSATGVISAQEILLGRVNHFDPPQLIVDIGSPAYLTYGQWGDLAIFDATPWEADDVGKSFSADASSDPSFQRLADLLVDGEDSYIMTSEGYAQGRPNRGRGTRESLVLEPFVPTTAVDLQGYSVTRIEIELLELQTGVGDGQWGFQPEFRFYGLPEPANSVWTPLIALVCMSMRRRSHVRVATRD